MASQIVSLVLSYCETQVLLVESLVHDGADAIRGGKSRDQAEDSTDGSQNRANGSILWSELRDYRTPLIAFEEDEPKKSTANSLPVVLRERIRALKV